MTTEPGRVKEIDMKQLADKKLVENLSKLLKKKSPDDETLNCWISLNKHFFMPGQDDLFIHPRDVTQFLAEQLKQRVAMVSISELEDPVENVQRALYAYQSDFAQRKLLLQAGIVEKKNKIVEYAEMIKQLEADLKTQEDDVRSVTRSTRLTVPDQIQELKEASLYSLRGQTPALKNDQLALLQKQTQQINKIINDHFNKQMSADPTVNLQQNMDALIDVATQQVEIANKRLAGQPIRMGLLEVSMFEYLEKKARDNLLQFWNQCVKRRDNTDQPLDAWKKQFVKTALTATEKLAVMLDRLDQMGKTMAGYEAEYDQALECIANLK